MNCPLRNAIYKMTIIYLLDTKKPVFVGSDENTGGD